MITELIYNFITTQLFAALPQNEWWTTNLDAIQGSATYLVCIIVLFIAVLIVAAIWKFFGNLLMWR